MRFFVCVRILAGAIFSDVRRSRADTHACEQRSSHATVYQFLSRTRVHHHSSCLLIYAADRVRLCSVFMLLLLVCLFCTMFTIRMCVRARTVCWQCVLRWSSATNAVGPLVPIVRVRVCVSMCLCGRMWTAHVGLLFGRSLPPPRVCVCAHTGEHNVLAAPRQHNTSNRVAAARWWQRRQHCIIYGRSRSVLECLSLLPQLIVHTSNHNRA